MQPARHGQPWEAHEDEYLRAHYGTATAAQMALELQRSTATVHKRMQHLQVSAQVLGCAECGTPIQQSSTGRPRRYCSSRCQNAKNRLEVREWVCWHCGSTYENTSPLLNCSRACKQAVDVEKQRAARDDARGGRVPSLTNLKVAAHVRSLLEAGVSQREIERSVGITQSSISTWWKRQPR